MREGKEEVINSKCPREDAIDFVSSSGKNKLVVTGWLDAGRPSGADSHYSHEVHKTAPSDPTYGTAKKGVTGHVEETKQAFTIRDDYDFANPGSGKGYHVNATLGQEKKAFTRGSSSSATEYYDRTNMTAERYYYDGPEEAASWYTQGKSK